MLSQLPRPSDIAVVRGKLSIASQRQREQAKLLAHVDKSREPTIDKTRGFNRAGPATPSSVERAHRLLQRSAMKQPPDVPLRARTMSPVLELLATIPEIPTTVERVAILLLELPATIPKLPPPVERVLGEQHIGGDQDTAPSTPPSKATPEKTTLDDTNNDPYYRCAAHRLCRSMGDQTSQFLMCIN